MIEKLFIRLVMYKLLFGLLKEV